MANSKPDRLALLNWIQLERNVGTALYKQIANQIRDAILAGSLQPGTSLPASRVLSRDLGVSRMTTLEAYEQLVAEGFLEARRGSGARVAEAFSRAQLTGLANARKLTKTPTNRQHKHLNSFYSNGLTSVEFQPGIPAFDAFPSGLWSRLVARNARRCDPFLLDYSYVGGYMPLRREIALYLRGSRGVRCEPEQVVIVTSVRAAITAVAALLWGRGSVVAVEDPGYMVARRVLTGVGCRICPVPVDDRGIQVERLAACAGPVAGAYLTPAHQWPMGAALSAERRVKLLDWAVGADAWIIEDDYDSEYRFDSPPLGTLHEFGSGRVIYVGTFSKTLAPSIRTAYLVVPNEYVDQFEQRAFESATEPPLHVQAALTDMIAEGHFTRHIGRMRKLYARRRNLLVAALKDEFKNKIGVVSPPGGLQIIVKLPEHVSAAEVSRRAAAVDLVVRDLEDNHVAKPSPNTLQLGFAAVPEKKIEPAVRRLAEAISDIL